VKIPCLCSFPLPTIPLRSKTDVPNSSELLDIPKLEESANKTLLKESLSYGGSRGMTVELK